MVNLEVILHKLYEEFAVFYAGGNVEGDVKFTLTKEKTFKSLRVEVNGMSKYHLGRNRYQKIIILSESIELFPEKHFTLPAGEHKFPFKIKLPFRLPQSRMEKDCMGTKAVMHEYVCIAILDDSSLFDCKCEVEFIVKRCDFSNYYPKLCRPITKEASNVSMLNKNNLLKLSVALPYAGMAISEVIPVTITIDNKSNKSVSETKIKLVETTLVDTQCAKIRVSEKPMLKDQIVTPVRVNDCDTFTYELKIPEFIQISDILYSHKYQALHSLVVKACGARVFIPILIGSKRAEESANQDDISPTDDEILEEYLGKEKFYSKIASFLLS